MHFNLFWLFVVTIIFTGCDHIFVDEEGTITPKEFIDALLDAELPCELVLADSRPELLNLLPDKKPVGIYKGDDFDFAIFDLPNYSPANSHDQNDTSVMLQNCNLILCGKGTNQNPYSEIFSELKPPITIRQIGFFIYPMGICTLIAIFVSCERIYSLRSGLTFPRKVRKALQTGEFPSDKWKKTSAAERIVWVATKEKPSVDSLRSYARLEITSMERGLFLLEVVVSAAPLLGLLGTVTGLVQVFSQIPSGGGIGDTSIFSEGIAMALLTTIAGLAIAIPALIAHSYIIRLVQKRASSLDWLTERLVDAINPKSQLGE